MGKYGIELTDGNRNIILSPETFTVRIVDVVTVQLGEMSPGQRARVNTSPDVRSGMFSETSPLHQYPVGQRLNEATFLSGTSNSSLMWSVPIYRVPSIPWVEVFDGYIEVCAPTMPTTWITRSNGSEGFGSGRTLGNIIVYILTKD